MSSNHEFRTFDRLFIESKYAFFNVVFAIIACNVLIPGEGRIKILFTPDSWSIPKAYALAIFMSLDVVGLLRGWNKVAHAAHLGGTREKFWMYFVCAAPAPLQITRHSLPQKLGLSLCQAKSWGGRCKTRVSRDLAFWKSFRFQAT